MLLVCVAVYFGGIQCCYAQDREQYDITVVSTQYKGCNTSTRPDGPVALSLMHKLHGQLVCKYWHGVVLTQ